MNDRQWDEICDVQTRRAGGSRVVSIVGEDTDGLFHARPDETQVGGVKHDTGKPLTGLMVQDFATALQAVADVTTFGAEKYSPSGWTRVPDARGRYTDALYRHLLAWSGGEDFDGESNIMHLAHAAWNVLALLQIETKTRA